MIRDNRNTTNPVQEQRPEVDAAARRMNEQILWENTVNRSYQEDADKDIENDTCK